MSGIKSFKSTKIACYIGYIVQGIVNNLSPLFFVIYQKEFGLSYGLLSSLIVMNFTTQIIVDLICVKFADKWGYRNCAVVAHCFSATGLILLGVLPNGISTPFAGLAIATICSAIGGGIIEVIISPIIDSIPSDAQDAKMSLLHSFYCWGQVGVVLITTATIKIIGEAMWLIIPVIWAIVPALNAILFSKVPLNPTVSHEEKIPLKKLFSSKIFFLCMLLMISAGASELAMSQWSSLFAEKGLGVPKFMGDILGPCLFAIFMGTGRTIYGFFGHKLNLFNSLIFCGALCVLCYLGAALFSIPILALLSCAFCGFSVSLMWPGVFSTASELYPKGGTAMFGVLAVCGDIGCTAGPALTGAVSDVVSKMGLTVSNISISVDSLGLKAGLLAATIFPLIMIICVPMLKRLSRRKNGELSFDR